MASKDNFDHFTGDREIPAIALSTLGLYFSIFCN